MGSAVFRFGNAHVLRVGVLLAMACVWLVAPATGSSGLLGGVLSPCSGVLSQPFVPWGDLGSYALVPNGGLESGSAWWTLAGGAGVVLGNEGFRVGGASDAMSLSLPPGSSAVSSEACVGMLSPTVRFFARNTGDSSSRLRVDVLYRDALGLRWSVPIAFLPATREWQPTSPYLMLANLTALPLLTNGSARVAFRFTAQGSGGAWQIDDVYVDPYKGT
jgi:hypothetical protein